MDSKENKEEKVTTVSVENVYKLNGRVPLKKAIPFGLQHVLAMFVSNLAPVLIVCSAALVRGTGEHLSSAEITQLKEDVSQLQSEIETLKTTGDNNGEFLVDGLFKFLHIK